MEPLFEEVEAALPWFFPVLAFGIGACMGSFVNVCIYRIPAGQSVFRPSSRCRACGQPIPPYLNLPILAWILLRGKAKCCGAPISIRYPSIEFLTAALFLASWLLLPPLLALIGWLWIFIAVCTAFIDLDHMIIPDRFSIGGLLVGLVLSAIFPALHGIESPYALLGSIRGVFTALTGALIGSSIILWIMILGELVLRKEAMGFGDVKLMGAIGAFCGWQGSVFALFAGAILGTVALVLIQIIHAVIPIKRLADAPEGLLGKKIPFGPLLAGASLLYYLFLGSVVDEYFTSLTWVAKGAVGAN